MQRIKQYAERHFPPSLFNYGTLVYLRLSGTGVFAYDALRFLRYYSKQFKRGRREQLCARITFNAHSIEKGLSHEDIRYGFGRKQLARLSALLAAYNRHDFDKKDKAYVNALSVLRQYHELHDGADKPTEYFDHLYASMYSEIICSTSQIGGITHIDARSKDNNKSKSFEEIFTGRYSVRAYSKEPVDEDKINQAIGIATKTPTVCNRQPFRVAILTNPETIQNALRIQGGYRGYGIPPVLLVVLTDTMGYVDKTERNQVYIDGGAFSMALLLGLEYQSLAACPLNAMFTVLKERKVRKLLDIEPSHNIIMFIAVGNFPSKSKVPKSFRYSASDISDHR